MSRPLVKAVVTTVLLGLALGAWIALAPRQLPGGSASYVVPSGSSMLPLLHREDLVVIREAPGYGVGDVIAYDSRELGRIVLHRVIRVEGDRFVTKGDNNQWIDEERPAADAVLGRMWVRVPGGGTALAWIRTPRNAAVLGTVAAVVVMGGVGIRRRRRRRRRGDAQPTSSPRAAGFGVGLRSASIVAGGLVLGFGALAAFAHLRSDTRVVPTDVPYQHEGAFEYSAPAERGAVYPDGRVDPGEPVFLRLADRVEVRFGYRFVSDHPHAVTGTAGLTADLEDGTGWRRSFVLQEPAPFTGDVTEAVGTLDLPGIGSLIRQVEKATAIPRPSYRLVLRPAVHVEGTLAGRPVRADHQPELSFEADPLLLRLSDPEDPTKDPLDALSPTARGSVVVRDQLPNPVSLGPVQMEPATARSVSLIGLGVSVLALLIVGVLFLRRNRSEPARIQARFGHRIVPVSDSTLDGPVVDVATMAALARIADSYERVILHEETLGTHAYLVEGDVALYRYRPGQAGAPRPKPEPDITSSAGPASPVDASPSASPPAPAQSSPAPLPTPASPPTPASLPTEPLEAAPAPSSPPVPRPTPHPHFTPANANGNGDLVAEEEWWAEDEEEDDVGVTDTPPRAPMRPSTLADDFFLRS